MKTLDYTKFPIVSQLDGELNEEYNCVAACVAACSNYLSGSNITAGALKQLILGKNFQGGENILEYSSYLKGRGLKAVYSTFADRSVYLTTIDIAIADGNPVIITEPSPYDPAGVWTHVCVVCGINGVGGYMVMDPFVGEKQEWTASTLKERIIGGIFVVSRITNQTPTGWKLSIDNATLYGPNGIEVVRGFKDYILQNVYRWDPTNVPCGPEHPVPSVLLHNSLLGSGTRQLFRDNLLWWTPQKGVVNEPFLGLELNTAYNKGGF